MVVSRIGGPQDILSGPQKGNPNFEKPPYRVGHETGCPGFFNGTSPEGYNLSSLQSFPPSF